MKILIVDDDLVSRIKMQTIVESFAQSTAVDCGQKAIDNFNQTLDSVTSPYDLILLDIEMPDMSGTDTLLEIRALEKKKNIAKEEGVKVIMVSSHSDKDHVTSSITAGCNSYIVKPFTMESLVAKMKSLGFKIGGR